MLETAHDEVNRIVCGNITSKVLKPSLSLALIMPILLPCLTKYMQSILRSFIYSSCFAPMRKLLAMIMSVTLLIISSMPMSAVAAICDAPDQMSSHDDMAAHMEQDMGHEETQVLHEHSKALNSDWQRDRIECGCGCHNSADALPHLLAPHMTSDTIQMTAHLSTMLPVRAETAWLMHVVRVPLPPPQI